MKKYKKPTIVGSNFNQIETDEKESKVVGIVPFILAAASAAAAVTKAVEAFDDKYMDYQLIGKLDKVE